MAALLTIFPLSSIDQATMEEMVRSFQYPAFCLNQVVNHLTQPYIDFAQRP